MANKIFSLTSINFMTEDDIHLLSRKVKRKQKTRIRTFYKAIADMTSCTEAIISVDKEKEQRKGQK
tara:strand:+ start:197 stop:394 length:198 start_codon:yes stop_codon:yes gene_type:complete